MYILKYHVPIINIYYQNYRSYPSGPSGKIFRKEPMRITQRKLDKKLSMDGTKREDSTGVQDLGSLRGGLEVSPVGIFRGWSGLIMRFRGQ